MHSGNFYRDQAIEYVKQAVEEDKAGNYAKALPLYMNAMEFFNFHLKHEKNPKIKEAITKKFTEYLNRAEEIRAIIFDDFGGPGPTFGGGGPSSSADVALATRPSKMKPRDGKGGDGEVPEAEQTKVKALSETELA